jgi:hypothetical protein
MWVAATARMTTTRVTTARMTATGMTSARVTPSGVTPTWVAAARPSAAGMAHPGMSTRTSAATDVAVAASAVPAMPTGPTAPAKTAAPGVTAPIEAGSAPAVVVPAVISSAENELSLFHVAGDGHRDEVVDRQGAGLSTEQGERKQGGAGIDPLSHETSPPFFLIIEA